MTNSMTRTRSNGSHDDHDHWRSNLNSSTINPDLGSASELSPIRSSGNVSRDILNSLLRYGRDYPQKVPNKWFVIPLGQAATHQKFILYEANLPWVTDLIPFYDRFTFGEDVFVKPQKKISKFDLICHELNLDRNSPQLYLQNHTYVFINFNPDPCRFYVDKDDCFNNHEWVIEALFPREIPSSKYEILDTSMVITPEKGGRPDEPRTKEQSCQTEPEVLRFRTQLKILRCNSYMLGESKECQVDTLKITETKDIETQCNFDEPERPNGSRSTVSDILKSLLLKAGIEFPSTLVKGKGLRFSKSVADMADSTLRSFKLLIRRSVDSIFKILQPSTSKEDQALVLRQIYEPNHSQAVRDKTSFADKILGLISTKKPKDRRSIVSVLTLVMSRSRAASLFNGTSKVSQYEWTAARMHSLDPGPLEKVIEKVRRVRRITDAAALKFFSYLTDNIERTAFGTKLLKLSNGDVSRIENIKTTKGFRNLFTNYFLNDIIPTFDESILLQSDKYDSILAAVRGLFGEPVPELSQCYKHDKLGFRCLHICEHDGKHKYTPDGALSASTVKRLLKMLTGGQIRSLAGLDETDVEKGLNNFERLRELSKQIIQEGNQSILRLIDDVEAYHKADFVRHFNEYRGCDHICCCLECGFRSSMDNIPCLRKHQHKGPCVDCVKAFSIFTQLEASVNLQEGSLDQEVMAEMKHTLKMCRQNLIDYRAHLVIKFDEKEEDKRMLDNLRDDECIVISDWKMKILAAYFRETQQQWFGKRGTSLKGCMVIYRDPSLECDDGEKGLNVNYHFMFTDDCTQDSTSVNAAKAYLYSELLPEHVKYAHFRADGAGCFSCNLTKISMVKWQEWTGITELSNRQSPSGAGKTNLDGMFGVLQRSLNDAANEGRDYEDADSIFDIFADDISSMKGASFHIYEPDRTVKLSTSLKGLNQVYKLELGRDDHGNLDGDVVKYIHSRWSVGERLSKDDIDSSWFVTDGGDEEEGDNDESDSETNIDSSTAMRLVPKPKYKVHRTSFMRNKSESPLQTQSFNERKEAKLEQLEAKQKEAVIEKQAFRADQQTKKGLFVCHYKDDKEKKCIRSFLTRNGLCKHMTSGKHEFEAYDGLSQVAMLACGSSGLLASGSIPNRCLAIRNEATLMEELDGDKIQSTGIDWFADGCYNKPKRKENFVASKQLTEDLTAMFDHGERNPSSKYTAKQAIENLRTMVDNN